MLIKLDEPLSALIAAPLLDAGHSVRSVIEQGWGGLKDKDLWPQVVAAKEFLVTVDKGFGDIRAYPPGTHSGILVLRAENQSLVEFQLLIKMTLGICPLEDLGGAVSVVTPKGLRVRRPERPKG